ncbi:MAG: glutamate--tRNA ligase [Acidobacteria bacterium]|jgi:glutamyl-tRNA synthetase|nr:glutamate--tRNA ligase [Acidobacteriota bacterium]
MKVRFAPSPTGHLHIGGVRTALFNYLFAKNQGSEFLLRIEDTDALRSSREMADEIIAGLIWLGIQWDEGPFYQSERFDRYREAAHRLLAEGKAYRCFCTAAEISARKNSPVNTTGNSEPDENEKIYKYDRHCLHLNVEQIEQKLREKIPYAVRFRVPPGKTYFKDTIHKEMETENAELEDFAILKSDHSPTYHLSVVVDDSDMGITHVIRGDDHLSNTFKQVLLFKALGLPAPKFAHLPLILGADKKKLSKRHGETSILEFKKNGYLPETLVNYLSQLSWLPADSKKIYTLEELGKQFSLNKLSRSSPVFDYDKLRFLNSRVIQQKEAPELLAILRANHGFMQEYEHESEVKINALIDLVKPRIKTLAGFEDKFTIYLQGKLNYNNNDLEKLKENDHNIDMQKNLKELAARLVKLDSSCFTGTVIEGELRACAAEKGIDAAHFIHPARFALTSEAVSPSIFDVFAFFGKEESLKRLSNFLDFLEKTMIKDSGETEHVFSN